MNNDDKKRRATIIVGALTGKPEEKAHNENGDEMDHDMGYNSASEEILNAVHSKDHKALKHALKSFFDMCMDEHEASESPEEEAAEHSEGGSEQDEE